MPQDLRMRTATRLHKGGFFLLESFLKAPAGDPVCADYVHDATTVWTGKLIRAQAPSIEGKCRPGP